MKILYLGLVEMEVYAAPRTHVFEVCENLTQLDHEVLLLTRKTRTKTVMPSCRVVYIPFWGFATIRLGCHLLLSSIYLLWHILRFKPACIYERELAVNCLPALICRLLKKPRVVEANGLYLDNLKKDKESKIKISFVRLGEHYILSRANGIIVNGEGLKQALTAEYDLPSSKIFVVDHGVDTKLFRPIEKVKCRQKSGLPIDGNYIGYVGSFNPSHNLEILIRIMPVVIRKIPQAKLVLVGGGLVFGKCQELVEELNLSQNVIFTGFVPYTDVPFYINAFDVSVIPAEKKRIETQGATFLKALEYLACGQPTITNDLPHTATFERFKDVVKVVAPGDFQALAKAIIFLLENHELRQEMGKKAREFVEKRLTWFTATKKTEEFLKSVLKQDL